MLWHAMLCHNPSHCARCWQHCTYMGFLQTNSPLQRRALHWHPNASHAWQSSMQKSCEPSSINYWHAVQAIKDKFGLMPQQLRTYIHYHPSYYHFHVHIMHISVDCGAGMAAGKAHLLDDVIGKLQLAGCSSCADFLKAHSFLMPGMFGNFPAQSLLELSLMLLAVTSGACFTTACWITEALPQGCTRLALLLCRL